MGSNRGAELVLWVSFLSIGPLLLVRLESSPGEPFGGLLESVALGRSLFAGASASGVRSAVSMSVAGRGAPLPTSCAARLVVRGPYALMRNPMAVAGIAQGFAVAVLWHVAVRPSEGRDLERRFGDAYRTYRAATPLWRPRLKSNDDRP